MKSFMTILIAIFFSMVFRAARAKSIIVFLLTVPWIGAFANPTLVEKSAPDSTAPSQEEISSIIANAAMAKEFSIQGSDGTAMARVTVYSAQPRDDLSKLIENFKKTADITAVMKPLEGINVVDTDPNSPKELREYAPNEGLVWVIRANINEPYKDAQQFTPELTVSRCWAYIYANRDQHLNTGEIKYLYFNAPMIVASVSPNKNTSTDFDVCLGSSCSTSSYGMDTKYGFNPSFYSQSWTVKIIGYTGGMGSYTVTYFTAQ